MKNQIDELRRRLRDISAGIMGTDNLELRQKNRGNSQAATYPAGWYEIPWGYYHGPSFWGALYSGAIAYHDAQTTLNNAGRNNWKNKTHMELARLLIHELAHVHEGHMPDQDNTGNLYDPYVLESMLQHGVRSSVDFRTMLQQAERVCGERACGDISNKGNVVV